MRTARSVESVARCPLRVARGLRSGAFTTAVAEDVDQADPGKLTAQSDSSATAQQVQRGPSQ